MSVYATPLHRSNDEKPFMRQSNVCEEKKQHADRKMGEDWGDGGEARVGLHIHYKIFQFGLEFMCTRNVLSVFSMLRSVSLLFIHTLCVCVWCTLYVHARAWHFVRLLWPFLLNFVYFICVIALWCTFINTKWSSYDFLSECEKGTYEDKKQKIHVLVHVFVWHIM